MLNNIKLKKREKSNLKLVNIPQNKKSLNHQDLKKITNIEIDKKENLFQNRKCSMKFIKQIKAKNDQNWNCSNQDKIFKKFLENEGIEKTPEKIYEFVKSLKNNNISLSKKILLKLLKKKEEKTDEKSLKKIFEKKSKKIEFGENLKELRVHAIKALVNEKFDLKSSNESLEFKNKEEIDKKIILLFQKELLLENLLNVLDSNKIDVTNILYTAFENIQSENYIPKTGKSLIEDGYFILEDKIQHPPKKKILSSGLKKNLKIDLNSISNDIDDYFEDDDADEDDDCYSSSN